MKPFRLPFGKTITTNAQSVVEINNAFAFEIYSKLGANDGNLCIAPFSIFTALAMTFAGARGATAKQMAKTMHITPKQHLFHQDFSSLLNQINTIGKKDDIELLLANSIFPHNKHSFLKSFVNCLIENYDATLTPVDYIKIEEARRIINQWVGGKTKEQISEIVRVGDIDEWTRLVLVNATYFKGHWEKPFDKQITENRPFWMLKDFAVKVPTMQKKSGFDYSEDELVQILELPYQGNRLSLIVILPKDKLSEVEKNLTFSNWSTWQKNLSHAVVDVHLPSFKIMTAMELNGVLSSMGMVDAFDVKKADFSGMDGIKHPGGFYISNSIHQANIEVNEEGTTATAATILLARLGGIPDEYEFRANRPFIFLLRENITGSILFIGRVQNPLA